MSDDIVVRLRLSPVLIYADELGQSRIDYEACKKYVNNEGVKMMREAADEIERLRKRLLAEENAYDIERRENEHLQTDRNNLALEVERLRAMHARQLDITKNLLEKLNDPTT